MKSVLSKIETNRYSAAKADVANRINSLEAAFYCAAKACHKADKEHSENPTVQNYNNFVRVYNVLSGWEQALTLAAWTQSELSEISERAYSDCHQMTQKK